MYNSLKKVTEKDTRRPAIAEEVGEACSHAAHLHFPETWIMTFPLAIMEVENGSWKEDFSLQTWSRPLA